MLVDTPWNAITSKILDGAIEVHRNLGPGLLESIYLQCLRRELLSRRLRFVSERIVPIIYKGEPLDAIYRIDLLVEDAVVVEVKSVASLAAVHQAQLLTYLKLRGCPVGLLLNFNVPRMMDGVKRVMLRSAM